MDTAAPKSAFDIALDRFNNSVERKDDAKITYSIAEEILYYCSEERHEIPDEVRLWVERFEDDQKAAKKEPEFVQYQMACSIKLVFKNAIDREIWLKAAILTDKQKGLRALNSDYEGSSDSPELLFLVDSIQRSDSEEE